ncbi:acyl-CoA reductase [Chitinophaga oryziterrae]|uniref:Acyl-CoA reductase n=1 Tax=Chitinophaga oryziterrae TaxID=1031224 RepID=A0A6N8JB44_9BACT|nr:acyl-CoA reductase [Chitinophaga oryziterrae]MVT41536.1 acyl-CoA reductase [Chitinophaga oryziterrae]
MSSKEKVTALVRLGQYLAGNDPELEAAKVMASQANGWFTPEFIDLSIQNICRYYLDEAQLTAWLAAYPIKTGEQRPRIVGIVAAGNIPLVCFHDWLCGFLSGHQVRIKLSSKDVVLMQHILNKMSSWYPEFAEQTVVMDMLKNCDAYIATGSNNSARYFHYYFAQYPNIIRRNRTSVAILDGTETAEELSALADDAMLYFGLGCRNVTKIFVPEGYNFEALLQAFRKYDYLADFHKFKNNYDYNLALLLLNSSPYMSNESLLLHEAPSLFSPISVLNYGYYTDFATQAAELKDHEDLQCLVGHGFTPFGTAQQPGLSDYADGIDTMQFLTGL